MIYICSSFLFPSEHTLLSECNYQVVQSAIWGSIAPAVWNFMLAARLYGLGTTWTSFHLLFEKEAAELLNIPYEKVMQVALLPVAYYKGTSFKPAPRDPIEKIIHINSW
jgi:nitroreductase